MNLADLKCLKLGLLYMIPKDLDSINRFNHLTPAVCLRACSHHLHLSVHCHHRAVGARCWGFPAEAQTNAPLGWWKPDLMWSLGAWMETGIFFQSKPQLLFMTFNPHAIITRRLLPQLLASVSCRLYKFMAYMTCTCMPRNQTPFKQKTEGSEKSRQWLFQPTRTLPCTRDHESTSHECRSVCSSE